MIGAIVYQLTKNLTPEEIKKAGFNSSTDLVNKLSFETYNGKFKNIKTSFDWLIQDEAEREKYKITKILGVTKKIY